MISPSESERTELERIELKHLAWRATKARDMNSTYVGGEGLENKPPVMIIGEAPGAEEVMRKRPFVGPSGRVLRQLMDIAGLYTGYTPYFGTGNVWLTNVVKFRPPNNRTPFPVEIMSVRHLLREEWKAVGKPRIVVPVGNVALHALVGKRVSILKHSGWVHTQLSNMDGQPLYVWPMVHPSFGLRNRSMQPLLERDWERLGEWLGAEDQGYSRGEAS